MSHNTSISLGEQLSDFVTDQVKTGRYGSASDVVRSGLRLLEERETQLRSLREQLVAGEKSGPAQSFDFAKFRADKYSS